jgi:hypothetical protein
MPTAGSIGGFKRNVKQIERDGETFSAPRDTLRLLRIETTAMNERQKTAMNTATGGNNPKTRNAWLKLALEVAH